MFKLLIIFSLAPCLEVINPIATFVKLPEVSYISEELALASLASVSVMFQDRFMIHLSGSY